MAQPRQVHHTVSRLLTVQVTFQTNDSLISPGKKDPVAPEGQTGLYFAPGDASADYSAVSKTGNSCQKVEKVALLIDVLSSQRSAFLFIAIHVSYSKQCLLLALTHSPGSYYSKCTMAHGTPKDLPLVY